ncbi:MAG: terminase large subunit [Gammaproteobacteria bacterium]
MTISKTYSERAIEYAKAITRKRNPISACIYVKQACNRFLNDLKRNDIILIEEFANTWCSFLEKLPHVKGRWAAENLKLNLSDWQIFCTVNIYGFYNLETKTRRFREIYIEVPRKNGKSFYIAGLGIGMMTIDNEFGAEVYCGATSEKQAWEIFRPAKQICQKLKDLQSKFDLEVNAKTLTRLKVGARFEPVIGDPGDGASPSCGIADEFHEHKTSDLVDTFITGMGAREQPLMLIITTAGSDMGGPCFEKRYDVTQILNGSVIDDRIFGIIYTVDEDDQWDTTEALIKANPNYNISVDSEFLEGQLHQARRSAIKQVAYKTKHLNLWVGAKAAWMNMLAYQACRNKDLKLEDFEGQKCFIGIDLASKVDIASMAIVFVKDGKYSAFVKHYLPEDVILEAGNTRYKSWHSSGHFEATPGNVIDYAYIESDLFDLRSRFEIEEVPYDPFQATQFSVRMREEGFPMIEVGATVKNFSEPMKHLEALIINKKIEFTDCPVLMWMFNNVVAKLDKKDNIFPNKERPENKIDGVVALIMAINRAMFFKDNGSLDQFLSNPVIL